MILFYLVPNYPSAKDMILYFYNTYVDIVKYSMDYLYGGDN